MDKRPSPASPTAGVVQILIDLALIWIGLCAFFFGALEKMIADHKQAFQRRESLFVKPGLAP